MTQVQRILNQLKNEIGKGCILLSAEGKILEANSFISQYLGLTEKKIIGKQIQDIGIQISTDLIASFIPALVQQEKVVFQGSIIHKKSEFPFEFSMFYIEDETQFLIGLEMEPLTEVQESNQLIQFQGREKMTQIILDHLEEIFWLWSYKTNNFIYISPSFEKNWPISRKELVQNPMLFLEAVHPDDRTHTFDILQKHDLKEKTQLEFRLINRSGEIEWIQMLCFYIYDTEGKITHRTAIGKNITESKKAEESIAYNQRIQETMYQISRAYLSNDLDQMHEVTNQSLEILGKFVNADRAYIFDYDFIHNSYSNTFEWTAAKVKPFKKFQQNMPLKFTTGEIKKHLAGQEFYIPNVLELNDETDYDAFKQSLIDQGIKSVITFPILDQGKLLGFVGFDSVKKTHSYGEREIALLKIFSRILSDIKKRTEIDRKLKKALQDAENANKAKAEFLANMSHEIRTPMNGILGFVHLLLDQETIEEKKEYLQIIKLSSENLMSTLNDILNFSKLESGKYTIQKELFPLYDVCEGIIKTHKKNAAAKQLDFTLEFDPKLKRNIWADKGSLEIILQNLLSNAVKFTHSGFIKFTVKQLQEQTLDLVVKDTGIGIDSDKKNKLFIPFEQGEDFLTKKYGGSGLGLSIVQKLVQLNQGSISCESVLDKGTEFSIRFPFENAADYQPLDTVAEEEINKLRIISAEDVEINQKLLEKVLEGENMSLTKVYDGKELIEKLETEEFDLILLDIQMPIMNGIDAARYIKKNKKFKHIPIIAVSAHVFKENIDEIIRAGADDYITKPTKKQELLEKIRQWTQK